jgi:drug/metabolite transporter (DMT)-like permease
MNWKTFKLILLVSFIGDCMSLCNVFSGEYTIMSHAMIFSNLGGILIVIYSIVKRQFVHKLEIIGTIIALLGCFITILDNNAKKVDTSQ